MLCHKPMADNAEVHAAVDKAAARRTPAWGRRPGSNNTADTFIVAHQPVWRDDTFLGVLIATVSVGDLSRAMIGIIAGDGSATDFVLYGRDQVLAHPALVRKSGRQTDRAKPLPTVADFDDGVLVSMWSEDRYPLYIQMPKGIQGHAVNAFGTTYLFVYRELDGYGPKPWLVGGYVNRDAIGEERRRLFLMAGMGAGALVLSLLIALLLARRIAGPVVRLGRRGGRGEPAGSGKDRPPDRLDLPGTQ